MQMSCAVLVSVVLSCALLAADCQPPGPRPMMSGTCASQGRTECPMTPPFMEVIITQDATYRYISTTTCPVYNNPEWMNPNQACAFQETYRIPLAPVPARTLVPVGQAHSVFENITYLQEDPAPVFGALGVLVTGVNIFGVGSPCGFSSKCPDQGGPTLYVDAVESKGRTVDSCGGHASPTNEYHIHSGLGINSTNDRVACGLPADATPSCWDGCLTGK